MYTSELCDVTVFFGIFLVTNRDSLMLVSGRPGVDPGNGGLEPWAQFCRVNWGGGTIHGFYALRHENLCTYQFLLNVSLIGQDLNWAR